MGLRLRTLLSRRDPKITVPPLCSLPSRLPCPTLSDGHFLLTSYRMDFCILPLTPGLSWARTKSLKSKGTWWDLPGKGGFFIPSLADAGVRVRWGLRASFETSLKGLLRARMPSLHGLVQSKSSSLTSSAQLASLPHPRGCVLRTRPPSLSFLAHKHPSQCLSSGRT